MTDVQSTASTEMYFIKMCDVVVLGQWQRGDISVNISGMCVEES